MTQSDTIGTLRKAMGDAANKGDFELAAFLRDRISILRGAGTDVKGTDIDTEGLVRQQPGAMGLGTSQQRASPPEGWVRPKKPDPMTKGRSRRGGGRSQAGSKPR
ncbi:UvrB/UvrC motif-containing protein [Sphingobium sufflavum]|uniref:UvrB/UvrC motif-containing protein n=1 Tax=Sphingobium sufflavum TaxID=1129547 RepID=UPI002279B165|nr:UvrB/UvrC motif-containing protein [Sphingobium sufflavum]